MIYEYKCGACNHIFEKHLRMADMDVPKGEPCPECAVTGQIERHISRGTPWVDENVCFPFKKQDPRFRDILSAINKKNYKSNLNSMY